MQFRVLSENDVKEIHVATLRVLERTGTRVYCEEGRKLLAEAGCTIVDDTLVKIPAYLVEECLRIVPKGFQLYDRLGNPALKLEGRRPYFGTGVTNPNFLDRETNEAKPTRVEDIATAARLADALPNLDWIMPLGTALDVPCQVSDVYEFEAAVTNTTKPMIFICHDLNGLKDVLKMAEAITGSKENLVQKPFIISYPEPTSPLVHTADAVEKLLYSASYGVPVVYTPCAMAGATAPVTMAGTLVQANAESLTGLVLAQLKRKGTPFVMGGVLTIMDMATTTVTYGAPELSLLLAGCSDLSEYYRLPTFGTAGCSDSKLPDEQAAIEATFSCMINAFAGLNLIHDPGFLEGAMIGSLEMLVMTNEIAGMVKRFMKGIPVNDETLAEDVIDDVGPGGHFLEHDHTRKHFRDTMWMPTLMDRQPYEGWVASGKQSMAQRVKERIAEILSEHKPIPLPDDVLAKIRKIKERSEKERVKK